MESIGYVLVYFLKGVLPWQNLRATNKKEKYEKIMEKKLATPIETLCKGLPQEFTTYLNYCKNLRFEDKPDYNYLKLLLKELFVKNGFEYDNLYDWKSGTRHASINMSDLSTSTNRKNIQGENNNLMQASTLTNNKKENCGENHGNHVNLQKRGSDVQIPSSIRTQVLKSLNNIDDQENTDARNKHRMAGGVSSTANNYINSSKNLRNVKLTK